MTTTIEVKPELSKKAALKATLSYMKGQLINSTIVGKRDSGSFIADRIRQATTKATLIEVIERFGNLLGCESTVYQETANEFFHYATSEFASQIHAFLRRQPMIAVQLLMASGKQGANGEPSAFTTAMTDLDADQLLQDVAIEADVAYPQPPRDIGLTLTCLSPLAHGADHKSGNATLYRRGEVIGQKGNMMLLPFYSANSIRGQLRDIMARETMALLGNPKLELWFFHTIFSGGIMSEDTKKLTERFGGGGVFKTAGMAEFRAMLPGLSVLGAALGNRIIPGRFSMNDFLPRCREYGTGTIPAHQLFSWNFFTRRDDNAEDRSDEDKHQGMIVTTEVLKPGAILDGGLDFQSQVTELEIAAMIHALKTFAKNAYIGAESRRGFGHVKVDIDFGAYPTPGGQMFVDFVTQRREDILKYLVEVGALYGSSPNPLSTIDADEKPKRGKKAKPAVDDDDADLTEANE